MSTAEREKISLNRNNPYGSGIIPRSLRPYLLLVVIAFVGLYTLTQSSSGSSKHEYGIMFDAGSTGSRIHVYKFHRDSNSNLILDDELFEQVRPGLSSYPDDIPGAVASIQHLVSSAKAYMDEEDYARTPLALKASAGLRILGEEKSKPILDAVGKALSESGFKQVWDPEIMDGDKEAVYSWVTLNYLAKVLGQKGKSLADSYGTLDLGGGSTQIAFSPKEQSTKSSAPAEYLVTEKAFDQSFEVYIHSYLGLGLMSARQLLLGGAHEGISQPISSPCFSNSFSNTWENARSTYEITGAGKDFNTCYQNAKNAVISQNVHKPSEIANQPFYAFSYYFDRAVEVGLITENGGDLKVSEFRGAAEKVCDENAVPKTSDNADWLCADLSLISALLSEGFGFSDDNTLKLYKKIDGIETQWALGATFAVFADN